jgi:thymidylate synthase (FAD)
MGKFVLPKVFHIGSTTIDVDTIRQYLVYSNNTEFGTELNLAVNKDELDIVLCSIYAKLCYKSLSLGQNANISTTRDYESNIENCFNHGHLSVFEHFNLNFIVTDCSRIFSHELVRHRVGTAFSQTSGRYCRLDEIDLVLDPILEPVKEDVTEIISYLEQKYATMAQKLGLLDEKSFDRKKKLTSALRRIAPNGQSNEMGFSVNIRSLRHLVMLRTNRGAEWEIRQVFNQVYQIIKEKCPLIFFGAKEEIVEGQLEITGMNMQPY